MLDQNGVEIVKEETLEEDLGEGYIGEPVKERRPIPPFLLFDIIKVAAAAGLAFIISLFFCIFGDAKWHLALITFALFVYFGWESYLRYDSLRYEEYIKFEGFVSSVTKKGVLNNSYYMVKIVDETGEKDLNFFYRGNHEVAVGEAVTLYIGEKEPVYSSADGPTINSYIGVEFSIISEEEQEALSSGSVSDYMKSKG